jgi:hypothetical protein
MNSNPFSIVPCSVCPSTTLLKTALIWKESVFCSPECLRAFVDNESQKREPQLNEARNKFFNSAL